MNDPLPFAGERAGAGLRAERPLPLTPPSPLAGGEREQTKMQRASQR